MARPRPLAVVPRDVVYSREAGVAPSPTFGSGGVRKGARKLSVCAKKVVHLIFARREEVVQLTFARREKLIVSLGARRKKLSNLYGETGYFEGVFMAVACFLGLKS